MRTHFLSGMAALLLLTVLSAQAFPQAMVTSAVPAPTWGTDKDANGSMAEWSSLGGLGGHGTVDNEWYFYDTGDDLWNDPQGGVLDEPLSILVMEDHPGSGNPEALASGFNLWGGYLCYEPYHDDYSVIVALDLPLSSNANVSQDYVHTYNGLPPGNKTFLPIAFDCDGNGDSSTVNSQDYFPASGNGFNYVKPGGLVFDDRDEEIYKVNIYLGDDNFPAAPAFFAAGGTDGLIIQVSMESEFGVIKPARAIIPGAMTKSGFDLDLEATYGGVLEAGGYNNPAPGANPRIVDIEVKINKLRTIIEDPTYIDWTKVLIGKFPIWEARKQYVSIKSGSLDDKSDEHLVQGGHVFPPLPFRAVVDKKVMCGNCAGSTTPAGDEVISLREADIRFEVDISVPAEFSTGITNGFGLIDVVEDCTYLVNGNPVALPGAEWELCEVLLNGAPNLLSIPTFNLSGTPARIKDIGGTDDYVFEPGDEVKVVFAVYPNTTAGTENYYQWDPDIANQVFIDGYDPSGAKTTSNTADAFVDILKPVMTAYKAVEFKDDNGVSFGPFPDLSETWWDANVPPNYQPKFPVTVKWSLAVLNQSPNPLWLDFDPLSDPVLMAMAFVVWNPLNMIPTPNPVAPANFGVVEATKIYQTYAAYQNDTNVGAEIHNTFTADSHVVTDNPSLPDICYLKDGQPVPDYTQQAQASAMLYLRAPPSEVAVIKHVSCFQNGPWLLEEQSFVDTWVYFRVWIRNISSSVPIDNTYITDDIVGEYVTASLDFISGPAFQPGVTKNLGGLAPDDGNPGGPDEIQIIFRVKTKPNFNTPGNTNDITNEVLIESDGPDAGTAPDTGPNSTASAGPIPVDILLGDLSVTKLVKAVDDNGVVYPYAESIALDPAVAYPVTLTWKVTFLNSSESPVTPNVEGHDTLLEQFPLLSTPPGGPLPPWPINNMPIGVDQEFLVSQEVKTFTEMLTLDAADGASNGAVDNTASYEDVQYTNQNICGTLFIPREEDSARVTFTPPEAVVEVEKDVSCFQNGPWGQSQMSFPATYVYFRIWIHNASPGIPIDHTYVTDTLAGAYTNAQMVSGPAIVPGVTADLGPLAPDDSAPGGPDEIEIIFKVLTDPNFNVPGNTDDIGNAVLVEADGPDPGSDPDNGAQSSDTAGPVTINIILGDITIEKLVKVEDHNGTIYGPSQYVQLDENTVYPIDITWTVTFENISEVPVTPDVTGRDPLFELFPLLPAPPGGTLPPWLMPNMPIGAPQTFTVSQLAADFSEADILDGADGANDNKIINTSFFEEVQFSHADVCGTLVIEKKEDTAIVGIVHIPEEEIPTLSEWGMILMAAALGALILLRMKRPG